MGNSNTYMKWHQRDKAILPFFGTKTGQCLSGSSGCMRSVPEKQKNQRVTEMKTELVIERRCLQLIPARREG